MTKVDTNLPAPANNSEPLTTSGSLIYGTEKITYKIIRKDLTNSRKIRIKVHPDPKIVVTAPLDANDKQIKEAVNKRARWIWEGLQEYAKQTHHVLPRRYVSGETQFYLGRRYVLKVLIDSDSKPSVKLARGKLTVSLSEDIDDSAAKAEKIKSLLFRWYQDKARAVFNERLKEVLPDASWVTEKPEFRIVRMKKQWGSCSTTGSLIFNPHLVKAPKECIDYVILHELCHIAEHNHSERFWRLLTQVMPHWKQVKTKLDGMAEFYLNE